MDRSVRLFSIALLTTESRNLQTLSKSFISLLAHIIQTLGNHSDLSIGHPGVHGDLLFLVNEDVEVDFFENITHIQLHRRAWHEKAKKSNARR